MIPMSNPTECTFTYAADSEVKWANVDLEHAIDLAALPPAELAKEGYTRASVKALVRGARAELKRTMSLTEI